MLFPVVIELHRSRILSVLLVLVHALAAACVAVLPWMTAVCILLAVLVGVSLWHALQPAALSGLRLCGRDRLECLLVDGTQTIVTVLPDSTVFNRLIVLRFRLGEEKRVRSLALFPDQMPEEKFRVLRLWLRWAAELKKGAEGGV